MVPVLSIVGHSGCGKTTLIEKIVTRLTQRDYRVGTIKHDVHGFDIDCEGKDSWRHTAAGAKTVILSSPDCNAIIKQVESEWQPDRLAALFLNDLDIVITEGYKSASFPKIEVIRKTCSVKPVSSLKGSIIAIASDIGTKGKIPRFDINDADAITDFIVDKFISHEKARDATLVVDGRPVGLKPFIENMFIESLRGMVKSLKGCGDPSDIELRIRL